MQGGEKSQGNVLLDLQPIFTISLELIYTVMVRPKQFCILLRLYEINHNKVAFGISSPPTELILCKATICPLGYISATFAHLKTEFLVFSFLSK